MTPAGADPRPRPRSWPTPRHRDPGLPGGPDPRRRPVAADEPLARPDHAAPAGPARRRPAHPTGGHPPHAHLRHGAPLGFTDPRHFARRFRAAYGITPSEWVRRHLTG
ncbi:AraC family transcriptional regulator [Dactylosporangium cerinum]